MKDLLEILAVIALSVLMVPFIFIMVMLWVVVTLTKPAVDAFGSFSRGLK